MCTVCAPCVHRNTCLWVMCQCMCCVVYVSGACPQLRVASSVAGVPAALSATPLAAVSFPVSVFTVTAQLAPNTTQPFDAGTPLSTDMASVRVICLCLYVRDARVYERVCIYMCICIDDVRLCVRGHACGVRYNASSFIH
jgi:hypothetical protein